ncbi:hypothetical protein BDU57DRAFT_536096 [Ampelomyces quisqualis]|uniref:DNA recombination and repair protein Rad51-like C-terminal domain-containing protein n=1 Tax=Ampelomyces quisqualis TaxID=50730 RepID=A0A6A5QTF9_AMPQU|nr:hypothetical protein BDU57DRAFT_536096 [Ampelomyces quisqualis]
MSASAGDGARKLGEKLLAEIEVEDLTSVFKALREMQLSKSLSDASNPPLNNIFGIPDLDALFPSPIPPILEIVSPPPSHHLSGAGKTSLLHLIIAHAILPSSFCSIPLSGQNAAIILFDPLHHFSVPRLASIMLHMLVSRLKEAGQAIDADNLKSLVATTLLHVHIFRPQSWISLLSTLRSLPDYLFDSTKHKSMHRRIHSIILDDVDAFVSSIRASTSTSTSNTLTTASSQLTSAVYRLTTLLSCSAVLTSQSTTPTSYRPALPLSWPQNIHTTRLAVRRVQVLKFAPAISVEEAEAERAQRWDVVSKGRFECWKVGVGARDTEGFVFRVCDRGVNVEGDEKG